MGFPMAEAYLFCEILTESHEIAPMTPSSLFTIASLGGLFSCVVLCLICSECYSRYRNRRAYHGITESSSGEHEQPTAVPSSIRNLQSEACAIPTPRPSFCEIEWETDRRSLLHARQLQSRRPHQSIVRRTPSYDQVVSKLDRRIISHAHQPRSRKTSESMARTKLSRSTSFEVVIEQGQQATPYPPESSGQAIQVEDPDPTTSSGNRYPVRITDTPPSLFEQVAQESDQYGLPTPSPNFKTMPQIYKEVRRAVQADDSELIRSHRSLQPAAQVTPTHSPPVDQAVRESDCQEVLQVHRPQSGRIHQSTAREVTAQSPSFDQVIQPPHQATPCVRKSVRQFPAFPVFQPAASSAFQPAAPSAFQPAAPSAFQPAAPSAFQPAAPSAFQPAATSAFQPAATSAFQPAASLAFQPAASSAFQPAASSPASQEVEWILARIPDESENSSLDYDTYSVLINSESVEETYLRRMYGLRRDLKITPPLGYLLTPPPSYSDLMMHGPFESPPILYSPTRARYVPAFLRVESPLSTPTSSKSSKAVAKSDIESSTETKGAEGGARSKSTEMKGAMTRSREEEALLQAKIAATLALIKEDVSKMTDETAEVKQVIAETKDAATTTEMELPLPKTEGDMPSTESKYALPETKGRPVPARSKTEWAHSKPRGATATTEADYGITKTDDAGDSTEKELSMPETKSLRTRKYRESVTLKTKGATGTVDTYQVFPNPEGATARIETEWPMLETEGATSRTEKDRDRPKIEGAMMTEAEATMAKSSDRICRDPTESSDLTGCLDTVPISTDSYATGGARPKILNESAKKKTSKSKSKSKRKNKKK